MPPLDVLLNFAQIVIPMGLAVPALLAFRSKESAADKTITVCWYIPLIALILVVVGIVLHVLQAPQKDLITILGGVGSVVITTLLLYPYGRAGKLLVDYQTSEVIEQSLPSPAPSA